jgi:hypothetical protein
VSVLAYEKASWCGTAGWRVVAVRCIPTIVLRSGGTIQRTCRDYEPWISAPLVLPHEHGAAQLLCATLHQPWGTVVALSARRTATAGGA